MKYFEASLRFPLGEKEAGELGFSKAVSPIFLEASKPSELKKKPKKGELLCVVSSDNETLRQACRKPYISFLLDPSFSGDVGLLKLAAEKNKPFLLPTSLVLESRGMRRAMLLSRMRFFVHLCTAFKTPLLLGSGAKNEFQLKTPRELVAIASALGLEHERAKFALSEQPAALLGEKGLI